MRYEYVKDEMTKLILDGKSMKIVKDALDYVIGYYAKPSYDPQHEWACMEYKRHLEEILFHRDNNYITESNEYILNYETASMIRAAVEEYADALKNGKEFAFEEEKEKVKKLAKDFKEQETMVNEYSIGRNIKKLYEAIKEKEQAWFKYLAKEEAIFDEISKFKSKPEILSLLDHYKLTNFPKEYVDSKLINYDKDGLMTTTAFSNKMGYINKGKNYRMVYKPYEY